MIFHVGQHEIDTEKVRRWVNSSRGKQIAFWSTPGALLLLLLTAWWTFGGGTGKTADDGTSVVLYTSVDEPLVQRIIDAFKAKTGVEVKVVTDTEATRGAIAQRLIAERESPRADVWWGGEPGGAVRLANERVLASWASASEATVPGGWPKSLRPKDTRWYGFAQRSRVIAFNTNQITKTLAPTRLRDLTKPQYKGKVGIADPRFGTTRTHMAYLASVNGENGFRDWLRAMKDNGLRVFPSNSAVAQALGRGEIAIGLTDTDDVWSAQREKWPVDLAYELPDRPKEKFTGIKSTGPLLLPNAVGRITGSPNPTAGAALADYLLSEDVERLLAESDSHNVPIRAELAKEFALYAVPNPAEVDFATVAKIEELTTKTCVGILGLGN